MYIESVTFLCGHVVWRTDWRQTALCKVYANCCSGMVSVERRRKWSSPKLSSVQNPVQISVHSPVHSPVHGPVQSPAFTMILYYLWFLHANVALVPTYVCISAVNPFLTKLRFITVARAPCRVGVGSGTETSQTKVQRWAVLYAGAGPMQLAFTIYTYM